MTGTVSLNDVTASMRAGWQLPAYLYSDASVYELERELIFRKGWLYVGLAENLQKAGDYFTAELGDIPIVVTRDTDGTVRGIVNACLHRLHPIASGEGCSRLLQCKYHGWTYGLDGALKTAPRSQHEPDFDRASMKLPTVRIEAFGAFLFGNADPDAPPLMDYLGEAPELVTKLALDFSGWNHAGSYRYEVDANWKLFMENSLECYHCDLVHHDTFATAIATGPEDYICENYINVLTQVAPIQHAPETERRSLEDLEKFRMLYVWPTTAFSVDEYAGVITRLAPLGPTRCAWVVDVFEKPGVDPAVLKSWMTMYDQTFQEDKAVVSAQQAGYDSGMISQGRLMQTNESSIGMFQRRTWDALAAALQGRGPQ
ncbi:aromatic ring-hydroxylating dioxygenase subunit alpha [Okibacterium endophyticum]